MKMPNLSKLILRYSLAGLVTARVLADYFSKVVIVEPETGIPLHGGRVGQRVQIHKYMDLAVLIFRKLFPGFDNQAKTYGIRYMIHITKSYRN